MADLSFIKDKKKKDTWITPPRIIEPLNDILGIDLDPCEGVYYDGERTGFGDTNYNLIDGENGLEKDWFGTVFVNPPFSEKKKWARRGVREFMNGNAKRVIFLSPDSTDVKSWYHKYIASYFRHTLFFEGRVNYIDPETKEKSKGVSFGTALSFLGNIPWELKDWAHEEGDLVRREDLLKSRCYREKSG